jgi:Uma2 family endonuclease
MKPLIETPPRTMMEVFKTLPEGTLAELIDEKLYMSPSPVFSHQKAVQEIFRKLCIEVLDKGKGEVIVAPYDVYLDQSKNAVQPDIIVVLNASLEIIDKRGHIHGVPDLLIEVLSPQNRDHDLVVKKELYQRFGVKEYWIVDPETTMASVFGLVMGKYRLITEQKGIISSTLLQSVIVF